MVLTRPVTNDFRVGIVFVAPTGSSSLLVASMLLVIGMEMMHYKVS